MRQVITRQVDQVFFSSSFLEQKFREHGIAGIRNPNACDLGTEDMLGGPPGNRPVFGYIGTMGKWFDWDCVFRIAHAFPAAPVRLIGPVFSIHKSDLPRNVELLPACRHEAIIGHLQRFSCGLIPFRRMPLTQGVDPIKYYEYRAMGLPVLSTGFGEMAGRDAKDGVFFLVGPQGLEAAVRTALGIGHDARAAQRFMMEHNWFARFAAGGVFSQATSG